MNYEPLLKCLLEYEEDIKRGIGEIQDQFEINYNGVPFEYARRYRDQLQYILGKRCETLQEVRDKINTIINNY